MFIIIAYFLGVLTPFFICKSANEILKFLKKDKLDIKEQKDLSVNPNGTSSLTNEIIDEWQSGKTGGNDDE